MARYVSPTYATASAALLVLAAVRPAPLLMVATISILLFVTWVWLFAVFLAHGGSAAPAESGGFR
jgi:hypothetical protein